MCWLRRHLYVRLSGGVPDALVLPKTFLGNAPGIQVVSWVGTCGQATMSLWPQGLRVGQHGRVQVLGALVPSKNCAGRDAPGVLIVLGLRQRCCIIRILGTQEKE